MTPPIPRQIQSASELVDLIRALKKAVLLGVLEQVRSDPSPFATNMDISELAEQGPWPDYLEMRFRVAGGITHYKLSVETYHGTGGIWEIEPLNVVSVVSKQE